MFVHLINILIFIITLKFSLVGDTTRVKDRYGEIGKRVELRFMMLNSKRINTKLHF